MAKIHRIKKSFTAGEISPLMEGRTDNSRFSDGALEMTNFLVKPQGPASRRPGFEFVGELIGPLASAFEIKRGTSYNKYPALVPFIFDEENSYVLVFFYPSDPYEVPFLPADPIRPPGTPIEPDVDPLFMIGYHSTETGKSGWIQDPNLTGNEPLQVAVDNLVTGGKLRLWRFDYAQSGDTLFITGKNVFPFTITRKDHDDWSVERFAIDPYPVGYTETNFKPEFVTFFEQRLVYASIRNSGSYRPQTIFFSKSGDFDKFYKADPAKPTLADDALAITLDSGTQNRITWMEPTQKLLVGTLGDEWIIGGVSGQPLTTASVSASRQTKEGGVGNKLKPISIRQSTLVADRFRRKVSNFSYNFDYDSYTTNDLSILAPHLTEPAGPKILTRAEKKERNAKEEQRRYIIDWAYQSTPADILWCVRSDLKLIALTYKEEHNVVGWHKHDTRGGFLAVTSIPGERQSDLWTVVIRDKYDPVTGTTVQGQFLERLADEHTHEETYEAKYLDSHYIWIDDKTLIPPVLTFNQLTWLAGQTVSVWADGGRIPDHVISEFGVLDLTSTGTNYGVSRSLVVGYSYESRLQPTFADIALQDGSVLGRMGRIVNIDLMFYRSAGAIIETVHDRGTREEEVLFREPWMDANKPIPLFTGIKRIGASLGWDNKPYLVVKTSDPIPLTVVGLIDEFEVDE